jgi:general secretion pathway protein F
MPIFEYEAINSSGKKIKSTIDADSVKAARSRLRTQGSYVTSIRESAKNKTAYTKDLKQLLNVKKVSTAKLAQETRQLATLVAAGIPLVESLQIISDQSTQITFKTTLAEVRERIEDGSSLAKAISNYPKIFPRLYINMVASGEASGTLDSVLENLADHLEAQVELKRKIQAALFYPIIMFGICILVVVGIVTFVVPTIVKIFEKEGTVLPLPTQIMIFVSSLFTTYWYFLILSIAVIILAVRNFYSRPKGRSYIDSKVLTLPIYGGMYQKIYTAQIATTLSTLISSGVELLQAMEIIKNIVGNIHVSQAIEDARDGVREGRSLAKEFAKSKRFPLLFCQMVSVGERSGKLEQMLNKAGKSFRNDVSASITALTALIEPAMIITLGVIVLGIVISVILPMFDLMEKVQG